MRAPKTFEEGMNRLEAILNQMQPETTLAESVKLYAEAAALDKIAERHWKKPPCRSTRSTPSLCAAKLRRRQRID